MLRFSAKKSPPGPAPHRAIPTPCGGQNTFMIDRRFVLIGLGSLIVVPALGRAGHARATVLRLHKLADLVPVTDELLQDAG
jgi:hypothetical protein